MESLPSTEVDLEITSSPPSKRKERGEMILTTRMVHYSSWKLKGPNSSSTGVGREGAWSRAALGPREKSIGMKIQKAEARIFRVGGTEECGRWGAKQWSRNNVGPFSAHGLVSSPALQADLGALARLPTLEVNDLIFPKRVFLLV